MLINGSDCSIVIKTAYREINLLYSLETLREALSLLHEEAAIEGDGTCRTIQLRGGVTGCVVTPLSIKTAPLLLYLAMGTAGKPVYISETRNLYCNTLSLLPLEDTEYFDLVQDRGGERKLYESCRVQGFEIRILREETIKLKLDITGEQYPIVYPCKEKPPYQAAEMNDKARGRERFSGDNVTYKINNKEQKDIYGTTLIVKKDGGTKTELWIKRAMNTTHDFPIVIEELTITARLLLEEYEHRQFGTFRLTLKRLVMTADETIIETADTVIGSLRYYVAGVVSVEVFSSNEEQI
jgi:hypothetical protein